LLRRRNLRQARDKSAATNEGAQDNVRDEELTDLRETEWRGLRTMIGAAMEE